MAPKKIVIKSDFLALLKFLFNISWWDQVIDTPEERRRIVFSSGILIGLKDSTEYGGHL